MTAHAPIAQAATRAPLRHFVTQLSRLIEENPPQQDILAGGARLLGDLVATDDWLPDAYAAPHPQHYQQYLLHCDSQARFSVVSFVWGPGQATPIHDHQVWGLVGVLRGAEIDQRYDPALRPVGDPVRLTAGAVATIDPAEGDIHRVQNAHADAVSISIHVYGADIGAVRRTIYKPDGTQVPFVSGYANTTLPNIWGQS